MILQRVVCIIQARMGSTRLPGKVLAEIGGVPMLLHTMERARLCRTIHTWIVATTHEAEDDMGDDVCHARGYLVYRGSSLDVLDRHYQAALREDADFVVRLTADCPLLDSELLDDAVEAFLGASPPADLVMNRLPGNRTYPIGLMELPDAASRLTASN